MRACVCVCVSQSPYGPMCVYVFWLGCDNVLSVCLGMYLRVCGCESLYVSCECICGHVFQSIFAYVRMYYCPFFPMYPSVCIIVYSLSCPFAYIHVRIHTYLRKTLVIILPGYWGMDNYYVYFLHPCRGSRTPWARV